MDCLILLGMIRQLRILILLLVLLGVAVPAAWYHYKLWSWKTPIVVALIPIAADDHPGTRAWLQRLGADDFVPVEQFFSREASRYGFHLLRPITLQWRDPVDSLPPDIPEQRGVLDMILWSLRFRWWAWQNTPQYGFEPADLTLFLLYRTPVHNVEFSHSYALRKTRAGVVKAFAGRPWQGRNRVVLVHELLHLFGASDKYDLATGKPLFPQGYADPDQQPLYPQHMAEIMAGRRAISPHRVVMAEGLHQVLIGPVTAVEMGWRE